MSRLPRHAARVLLLACWAPSGCDGIQSALDPAGPGAARIGDIWWLMLLVCTAVFALVMIALLWAVARRRRPAIDPALDTLSPDPRRERRMARARSALPSSLPSPPCSCSCSRAIGSAVRWSRTRRLRRSAST